MENNFDANFFKKRVHLIWRAAPITNMIMSYFKPKTMIDLGCSIGEFIREFECNGVESCGVELSQEVTPFLLCPKSSIFFKDLTKPLKINDSFDIALCFMVVGRLPESKWGAVAKNIKKLSKTAVTVVENEQRWAYEMWKQGFTLDAWTTSAMKKDLAHLKDKTAVRSFYNHIQVFFRTWNGLDEVR